MAPSWSKPAGRRAADSSTKAPRAGGPTGCISVALTLDATHWASWVNSTACRRSTSPLPLGNCPGEVGTTSLSCPLASVTLGRMVVGGNTPTTGMAGSAGTVG